MEAGLEGVLKALTAGNNMDSDMAKSAQQVWKMLDTMAENPEEYKQFQQTMREAAAKELPAARLDKQAQRSPSLIVHAAVMTREASSDEGHADGAKATVNISNIVPAASLGKDEAVMRVVISFFEASAASATANQTWKAADGVAALRTARVPFKVCPLPSQGDTMFYSIALAAKLCSKGTWTAI
jgi:hypothetical protein